MGIRYKMSYVLIFIKNHILQEGKMINVLKDIIVPLSEDEMVDLKEIIMTEEMVLKHYHEHIKKPFFFELMNATKDKKVLAMVIKGENMVKKGRDLVDKIRDVYQKDETNNAIHCSDSDEAAEREIKNLFPNLTYLFAN